MSESLQYFVILPLIGLLILLAIPRSSERLLVGVTLAACSIHLAGVVLFATFWLWNGSPTLDIRQLTLYESGDFVFFIDFLFDRTTLVFAVVGSSLTLLVSLFSKYYMHRDDGFKRFFCALSLFFLGYNLLVFAGNLETLFIGWEIIGVTSFLLIAFYRERYLPVKNAFKVLSYYRIGDICLMLAMWMCHHLFHRNVVFSEWSNGSTMQVLFQDHWGKATFVAFMLITAAAVKSGQLPFSNWLPRAMEGPTNSSAIFYGALASHLGVFLLLRTFEFWESQWALRFLVMGVGLVTCLVATGIARVQSTVKTQIAYSSIAQMGLMFVEIAAGWHLLAMVHFAGNALMRTYQILVSPSVLSYQVHNMFFEFVPHRKPLVGSFYGRLSSAAYLWSLKESNLEGAWQRYAWRPTKALGQFLNRGGLGTIWLIPIALTLFGAGVALHLFDNNGTAALQIGLAGLSQIFLVQVFAFRGEARNAWLILAGSQGLMFAAVQFLDDFSRFESAMYLGGMLLFFFIGYACLLRLVSREGSVSLDCYHGHAYEHRRLALLFLVCCLAFAGFPITPTFLGVDLIFARVGTDKLLLIALVAMNWLILELALIRIYIRVFLGPYRKLNHPVALRSS